MNAFIGTVIVMRIKPSTMNLTGRLGLRPHSGTHHQIYAEAGHSSMKWTRFYVMACSIKELLERSTSMREHRKGFFVSYKTGNI
jgi:hypothetical protein